LGIDVTFDNRPVQSVPDPGSLALMGAGMRVTSFCVTWFRGHLRQS
jgi:hypothetical protein